MKKESIELTKEQRAELEEVIKKGTARARKIQHAHVLLKIDSSEAGSNWSDQQVKEAFEVSIPTIWRIRQRFLEQGLNDALNRRPQPEREDEEEDRWRARSAFDCSYVQSGTRGIQALEYATAR